MPAKINRISTCFGFNDRAEEAARFYVSIFPGGRITGVTHAGKNERGGPPGRVRTVSFTLLGREFLALNGGPHFTFSDGVSLMVNCTTQKEIDTYWRKLSQGGEEVACGWLRDKFGVSWQIVPAAVVDWLSDRDPERSARVMAAVMTMTKLDLAALRRARDGTPARRRRSR
jgi:predicted 3-demethylubiquinone-9 3-methyltransferase (glyoxalase superfamily)